MGYRRGKLAWMVALVAVAGCQAPEGRSEPSGSDGSRSSSRPQSNGAGPVNAPSVPPGEAPGEAQSPGARPVPEEREAGESPCGIDKVKRYLNTRVTEGVKAAISRAVGQGRIRYIRPGDAVTMDFSPSRLNVELGSGERIVNFRCG